MHFDEAKDITAQEVMQMESFRHFTEEQANELLQFVETFCDIAYAIWSRQAEAISEPNQSFTGVE